MNCEDCIANLGSPESTAHLESCASCAALARTANAIALPPMSAADLLALEALPVPEAIIARPRPLATRFAGYAIAAGLGALCVFAAERNFKPPPTPAAATASICPADSASDDDLSDDWGFYDWTWLSKLENSNDDASSDGEPS